MDEASASRHQPRWVPALLVASMIGSVLSFGVSAASSDAGTTAQTGCWDEYRSEGLGTSNTAQTPTRDDFVHVVVPQGLDVDDCTPGVGCYYGAPTSEPTSQRIFVPHGVSPDVACDDWGPGKVLRSPLVDEPVVPTTEAGLLPVVTIATTSIATTSTHDAPTTAATATTTNPPQATTALAAIPTWEPGSGFEESFDNDGGVERFRTGVYHRDRAIVNNTTWLGDHDLDCGPATTTRTIHRDQPDDIFYVCDEHLLTAVGDTAGYSAAFFSPYQTFTDERSVSWAANITDLGSRQWWEVAILPLDADDLVVVDWLSPAPSSLEQYPESAVVVGIGPFGGDFRVTGNGQTTEPLRDTLCATDPEGCASTTLRRPFTVTDNGDNTITILALGETITVAGSFPDGGFKVVFTDHNYTPEKGIDPRGHTWHWDDIAIL